jgi:anti-sigma B factor antagonist
MQIGSLGMTDERDGAALLTLSEARHGSAIVLAAVGDVDVATGPQLRALLSDALGEAGIEAVVLDLRGVTFMGSTAIAVLVDAHWEAGQAGKSLRLVAGDSRSVVRPLEAAGVASMFADYPDVEKALRG